MLGYTSMAMVRAFDQLEAATLVHNVSGRQAESLVTWPALSTRDMGSGAAAA
jgi:hypothetical protein